jgi:hypothetical protein
MAAINLTLVATIVVVEQAWGKAVANEEPPPNNIDPDANRRARVQLFEADAENTASWHRDRQEDSMHELERRAGEWDGERKLVGMGNKGRVMVVQLPSMPGEAIQHGTEYQLSRSGPCG